MRCVTHPRAQRNKEEKKGQATITASRWIGGGFDGAEGWPNPYWEQFAARSNREEGREGGKRKSVRAMISYLL